MFKSSRSMAKDKRSFFERLTGSVAVDEYDDSFDDDRTVPISSAHDEEETAEGQLTVDVFQKPDEIVIRAIVAGVRPDDLDVSITRDMVTIRGKREEHKEVERDDYFYKELYWGSFSRTILLPQEIDVELAEANEKHGLLTIRLPKIDKGKQTKLKVRANG